MTNNLDYKKRSDETFDDYFVRLFENKTEYGLTCEEIALLLNTESGTAYGESKWRKDFAMFQKGRIYEQAQHESGVCTRILSISDLHVPYQLPIETFKQYAGRIDVLQLNGDLTDAQSLSKFTKVYRNSPVDEIVQTRQYLIDLIELLKPKTVVANYGNHDARMQSYLARNLDSDLLELMPETSLDLIFEDGIRHYDKRQRTKMFYEPLQEVFPSVDIKFTGNWHCQIGKVIFCHPLAFKSGIMKTSMDAVSWFRNSGYDFTALVMAHTHRIGEYAVGNTIMYEQGCCCDTSKMNYADGKLTMSQREGFLYLCLDANGNPMRDWSKLVYLN